MVHSSSPLARIVKAGSSSFLQNSTLGLSSSFQRWNVYSLSTMVNLSMTSPGTPWWTRMTLLAVALWPAPKTILCSSGMHFLVVAVFEVATTVIIRWDGAPELTQKKTPGLQFWLMLACSLTDRLIVCCVTLSGSVHVFVNCFKQVSILSQHSKSCTMLYNSLPRQHIRIVKSA